MTVPGAIARKPGSAPASESPESRSPRPSAEKTSLSSAEPWKENRQVSRREYFQNLIPSFGASLVRGLRELEQLKRNLK